MAGAILSGAIFGDNLAPVSDVAIISAMTQTDKFGKPLDLGIKLPLCTLDGLLGNESLRLPAPLDLRVGLGTELLLVLLHRHDHIMQALLQLPDRLREVVVEVLG